jgi:hypothetical protein
VESLELSVPPYELEMNLMPRLTALFSAVPRSEKFGVFASKR